MIEISNVSKTYETGTKALKDININIERGEFVFIKGRSGSGKTTLLRLLLKEMEPTIGSITVNGQKLSDISKRLIPKYRQNIGMVFQNFRLIKEMNVYENVAFAQRILGVKNSIIKEEVPLLLNKVGLSSKYKVAVSNLSGGEKQRVAIARALINKPDILLCDEPTGNLDMLTAKEIMKLLEEINNENTTVIVVSHSDDIINFMKKRVITMKKGVIVSDTAVDNI